MKESNSAEETLSLGLNLALELRAGSVVALFGDLGAGKTTFLKGLIRGLTGVSYDEVSSPTFTYLNIYPAAVPVFHFDLYRLRSEEDFTALGFQEYFSTENICCLEWAEKIPGLLPPSSIRICFEHAGEDRRKILISS